MDRLGFDAERLAGDAWLTVPLLTREDLQLAGDRIQSTAIPAEHGGVTPCVTSGSTGKPVSVTLTGLTDLFWQAMTLRDHLWHERDFSGHLAAIRATNSDHALPPHGTRAAHWGQATAYLFETGGASLLSIRATIDEQARWLHELNPEYLLTYPSNFAALSRYMQSNQLGLSRLREVRTMGEAIDPTLRQRCQDDWGVRLTDTYSCQEAGYLAIECPQSTHYHVQSESVLLEVLDDAGRPCKPGEIGRVVITALHNYATPLIRYEIGDYAEVGESCSCGRGLPILRRVMGRRRNMFVTPDGAMRWPALEVDPRARLADLPPVRQFQVIQRSLDEIEAVLAVYRPLTREEEQGLSAWFAHCLNYHDFRIRFTYVDHIAAGAGGKYEDFRSDVIWPGAGAVHS